MGLLNVVKSWFTKNLELDKRRVGTEYWGRDKDGYFFRQCYDTVKGMEYWEHVWVFNVPENVKAAFSEGNESFS